MPIPQNARKALGVTLGISLVITSMALIASDGGEEAIECEEAARSISGEHSPDQGELERLRRRNALLETLLRATVRRSVSRDPGTEIEGPNVAAPEAATDDVEARFLEFDQALTRNEHDPDSDDIGWDRAVEHELQQMTDELSRHVEVVSLRCVSWLCRVELRAADGYNGAAEISAFMAKAATLFPESTATVDDTGKLRLLFSASASPAAGGGLESLADD